MLKINLRTAVNRIKPHKLVSFIRLTWTVWVLNKFELHHGEKMSNRDLALNVKGYCGCLHKQTID